MNTISFPEEAPWHGKRTPSHPPPPSAPPTAAVPPPPSPGQSPTNDRTCAQNELTWQESKPVLFTRFVFFLQRVQNEGCRITFMGLTHNKTNSNLTNLKDYRCLSIIVI